MKILAIRFEWFETYNRLDLMFWILSLVIATGSAIFAFVAAVQSSRSANELKQLTQKTYILNEVQNIYNSSLLRDVYKRQ